jgi:hypothetical protein
VCPSAERYDDRIALVTFRQWHGFRNDLRGAEITAGESSIRPVAASVRRDPAMQPVNLYHPGAHTRLKARRKVCRANPDRRFDFVGEITPSVVIAQATSRQTLPAIQPALLMSGISLTKPRLFPVEIPGT